MDALRVFMVISHRIVFGMHNVSNATCTDNQNTNFISDTFFFEGRAFYEIMWKIVVQPERPQLKAYCGAENIQFACRILT